MGEGKAASAEAPQAPSQASQARPLSLAELWQSVAAHRLWSLAPLALLILGLSVSIGPLRIDLSALWLIAAAWLCARHAGQGFAFVAVAALPLLATIEAQGIGTSGEIGLYLAALLVGRLFGDAAYRSACLAAHRVGPWALAFLFVVLGSDAGISIDVEEALRFGLWTGLGTYFFMVLVIVGLSSVPLGPIAGWLCLACVAGLALGLIHASISADNGWIGYRLTLPRDLIAGLVALWIGRLLRPVLLTSAGERQPPAFGAILPLLGALALVAIGGWITLKLPALTAGQDVSLRFGSAAAAAGLLFIAGALGGPRGALAAIAIWLVVTMGPAIAMTVWAWTGTDWLLAAGRIRIGSPPPFVDTGYWVGPNWRLAPFDALFAGFGWAVWHALHGRAAAPPPLDDTPPPLRYQFADRILVVLIGLVLATAIAMALWPRR